MVVTQRINIGLTLLLIGAILSTAQLVSNIIEFGSWNFIYYARFWLLELVSVVCLLMGFAALFKEFKGRTSYAPMAPVTATQSAIPIRFCRSCGTQIPQGASFCPSCGKEFK